ncbi:hypothetical protein T4E_6824 [Trichinella pseudospiralis]|uniref:Uncharacterized protein n=1 Tax=Trichinella pseudospiralis TaxID=6337 RepID=A0A0V0YGR2_TRIPS|nr:hypothetical protein T4E_6824 [Trichinella pseudospiralis]
MWCENLFIGGSVVDDWRDAAARLGDPRVVHGSGYQVEQLLGIVDGQQGDRHQVVEQATVEHVQLFSHEQGRGTVQHRRVDGQKELGRLVVGHADGQLVHTAGRGQRLQKLIRPGGQIIRIDKIATLTTNCVQFGKVEL